MKTGKLPSQNYSNTRRYEWVNELLYLAVSGDKSRIACNSELKAVSSK